MTVTWYNNDGLQVRYGTDEATASKAGAYNLLGKLHEVEISLTGTAISATAGTIVEDNLVIPKGARVHEVQVIAQTACTGPSAVLNVGLKRTDRSTELDYDGLIAALPLTSLDAAGETTTLNVGSTYAGALLGTTLANNGQLCADYDTAAFTAGVIVVRIRYYFP
jgi:hypothetical protein